MSKTDLVGQQLRGFLGEDDVGFSEHFNSLWAGAPGNRPPTR